jgi:hypothetical protein
MTQPPESRGLVYQGKPLSAGLDEVWSLDSGVGPEAGKAVRQVGTNAVPYLFKLALCRNSSSKAKVWAVLPEKWLVIRLFRRKRRSVVVGVGRILHGLVISLKCAVARLHLLRRL